jgi:hypothetical protein
VKQNTQRYFYALFISSIFCSFVPVKAQKPLLEKKIRITSQSGTVEKLLSEIAEKGGFTFTYSSKIPSNKYVKLSGTKQTVRSYLNEIFSNEYVKYYVKSNKIVLIPSDYLNVQSNPRIIGKVIDEKTDEPIQFANIFLKNKSIGTVSNVDGKFDLNLRSYDKSDTLCISYLGYQIQKIPLSIIDSTFIAVKLSQEDHKIKEVWVKPVNPVELIEEAVKRIPLNYDNNPSILTAFFRESSRQDDQYIALSEAVLSVYKESYVSLRNDQIKILKGRKGSNVKSQEYINYIVQGGLYNNFKLDIVKYGVSFLDNDNFNFYDYKLEKISRYKGVPVYVIRFDQKDLHFPLYKGRIYIDKESYAIVKAEFSLSPKGIGYAHDMYVVRSPVNLKTKPLYANYFVNYRKINRKWNLDYVRSEVSLFIKRNRKSRKRNKISSTFTSISEFVITDKDTVDVLRFKNNEISKSNDILVKQISETDEDFWGKENIILPDEPLLETIVKLNRNRGAEILPEIPVARTEE